MKAKQDHLDDLTQKKWLAEKEQRSSFNSYNTSEELELEEELILDDDFEQEYQANN